MKFEDDALVTIVIKTQGQGFQNYCYLVYDKISREGALIDPAWEIEKINSILYEHKVILRHVFLTHSHFDHTNLSAYYTQVNGINTWISKIEFDYYKPDLIHYQTLVQGQEFELGNQKVLPIHTPGHTKGSTCFLINNFLFTGDSLFPEGCGVCNCIGGNPQEMYATLQLLKLTLSNQVLIFQGHHYGIDPGMSFQEVKKNNIYLQIDDEETFIKFRMRKNQKNYLEFH